MLKAAFYETGLKAYLCAMKSGFNVFFKLVALKEICMYAFWLKTYRKYNFYTKSKCNFSSDLILEVNLHHRYWKRTTASAKMK